MKEYTVSVTGILSVFALNREDAELEARYLLIAAGFSFSIPHVALKPLAPLKWKVGMLVEYVNNAEWGWCAGTKGRICQLDKSRPTLKGSDYQVFWVNPLTQDGVPDKKCTWWTTPRDVRIIYEDEEIDDSIY